MPVFCADFNHAKKIGQLVKYKRYKSAFFWVVFSKLFFDLQIKKFIFYILVILVTTSNNQNVYTSHFETQLGKVSLIHHIKTFAQILI